MYRLGLQIVYSVVTDRHREAGFLSRANPAKARK